MTTEYRIIKFGSFGRKLVAVWLDPDKAEKFLELLQLKEVGKTYPVHFEIEKRVR